MTVCTVSCNHTCCRLLGTLAPGESLFYDHRLMGCCDSLGQQLGTIPIASHNPTHSGCRLVHPGGHPTHPGDIGLSFVTAGGGTVDMLNQGQGFNQQPWYLNETCELSTVLFVLYGAPADEKDLRILRVDGAIEAGSPPSPAQCSYAESSLGVFDAELAAYNAAPREARYVLGFGLSRFLPFGALVLSRALGYQQAASFAAVRQMSDVYVTVFDEAGPAGTVLLYPSKHLVHAQKRNLLGVETGEPDGALTLRSLQSAAADGQPDDVLPGHFRLLFVHLAVGLPAMELYANDDVLLTTVTL